MEDNDYISESDSMSGSDSSEEMESQQYGGHYTKPGKKNVGRVTIGKGKYQGMTRSKAAVITPPKPKPMSERGPGAQRAKKGLTAARNAVYLKNHPEAFGFRLAPFKKLMKAELASASGKPIFNVDNTTFSRDGVNIIKEYMEHILGQVCHTAHAIRARTNPKRISIKGDIAAAAHILGMPMSGNRFGNIKFGGALRRIALRNDCLRMTKEARKSLEDLLYGIMFDIMRNVGVAAENHLYTILDGKVVLRGKKGVPRKAHIRTQDIQTAIDTFREKRVLRV